MIDKYPLSQHHWIHFGCASGKDYAAFQHWRKTFAKPRKPMVADALELTALAFRRWREERNRSRVADRTEEFAEFIQNNPHDEVAMLILAKASWRTARNVLGLCHFRRTWCNNLYIDFLTVHPQELVREKSKRTAGIGSALLYFVASTGAEINAGALWGEATQNSAAFYQKVFAREDIKDLIYLTKAEYLQFRDRMKTVFQK